jgi:hypothetical protein
MNLVHFGARRARRPGWLCLTIGLTGASSLLAPGCDSTCDRYLDDPPESSVTLRFSNSGATPIYLGMTLGCTGLMPYDIRPAGQTELTLQHFSCGSCAELQESTPMCDTSCNVPPVVRIDPGGEYSFTWDGRHYISEMMPDSCYADDAQAVCTRRAVVADGSYEVTGYAFDLCSTDPGTGDCSCTPSADGSCPVDGAAMVEGTRRELTLTFDYPGYPPGTTELEFAF